MFKKLRFYSSRLFFGFFVISLLQLISYRFVDLVIIISCLVLQALRNGPEAKFEVQPLFVVGIPQDSGKYDFGARSTQITYNLSIGIQKQKCKARFDS